VINTSVTEKQVIEMINRDLLSKYRVLDGRPIYRVVFSGDQYETRKGKFTDWYGHIMIREVTAVRTVPKYWYIKPDCWVLERLTFFAGVQALKEISEELVEARNGSYETLLPFRDGEGNPLPCNQRIVDLVIWKLHNPTKVLPSDIEAARVAEEQEETKYFEGEIGKDERPELFIWDNSAFVSTRQLAFKQEYVEKSSKPLTGLE